MRFADDRLDLEDAHIDVLLQRHGYSVRYDIVPHPPTRKVTPAGDLESLKELCIPYTVWGFRFWRLSRGIGLRVPLPWDG
jgi:hypothetical protein